MSDIEWTNETWNCIVGCSPAKGSEKAGCWACYAQSEVHRFKQHYDRPGVIRLNVTNRNALTFLPTDPITGKSLGKGAKWTGEVWLLPHALIRPLRVRKPTKWFVNSISDLAHESICASEGGRQFIAAMIGVMVVTPQHIYQCLTKREVGLRDLLAWIAEQAEEHGLTEAEFCVLAANDMLRESGDEDLFDAADDLMDRWLWGSQGDYGFEASDEGDAADIRRRIAKAKRNYADDIDDEEWPRKNIWLGVSVEDQRAADERIPVLLELPAAVRFLSCEPLLGPLDLTDWIERVDHCSSCGESGVSVTMHSDGADECGSCHAQNCCVTTWGTKQADDLRSGKRYEDGGPREDDDGPQIHWAIVGGESGPKARSCEVRWIRSIVEQCRAAGVSAFVKQLGARPVFANESGVEDVAVKLAGLDAKGGNWDKWPGDLRVREFPEVRL